MRAEQLQLNADLEDRHWWFRGRRRIVQRLVRQVLPPAPDATVIDVGCGTGGNLGALAQDYRCVGIDTSADAIDLARRRFPAIRFIHGEAPRALGDDAPRASLFLLTDVIEHVPDDFEFLSTLLAASRPGALFLVTVPADPGLWTKHDETHLHYRRYDRARLEKLWQGLPVSCLLLSHFNARLHPMIRAIRAWNRRRGTTSGRAGTDLFMPARPVNWALGRILSGEARTLEDALDGQSGYSSGVSLIAILRRKDGEIRPRKRPEGLA